MADPSPKARHMRLGSTDDLIREHPGLATPTLRRMVSNAADNGLSAHLYRPLGPRGPLLVDMDGFAAWMRERRDVAA